MRVGKAIAGGGVNGLGSRLGSAQIVHSHSDVPSVSAAIHTVGGGQDPVLVNDGRGAEEGVDTVQGRHPGELVGVGLGTSDNLAVGGFVLNTAVRLTGSGDGVHGGGGKRAGLLWLDEAQGLHLHDVPGLQILEVSLGGWTPKAFLGGSL